LPHEPDRELTLSILADCRVTKQLARGLPSKISQPPRHRYNAEMSERNLPRAFAVIIVNLHQQRWFAIFSLVVAAWGLHGGNLIRAAERDDTRERYARRAAEFHGDPVRGRQLVRDATRAKCLRCHKIGSEGTDAGPDLSNVGGKLGREHLVESILEPSRQIVEGFRGVTVLTRAGKVLTGFVANEAEGMLTLINADGDKIAVSLMEIEDRKTMRESPMPERLASALSPDEFCDVIAYLETLRAAGQSSPGSGLKGAPSLPANFEWRTIGAGLTGVTALVAAPDGRVFVCEQTGTLRVVRDDRLLPEPVLRVEVDDQWERGLIGVTVDTNFIENQQIYVVYVAREPYPHHRVSRFTLQGDFALPGSERVLLEGDDQTKLGGNIPAGHQGGAVHFGADGKLYVAIGEQTAEAPAQSLETLQGKILRIAPDGAIPPDNPFVGDTSSKYRAIWARGCRNPFTFAVDRETGLMLINDVGGKFEEINAGIRGANYGWPLADHGPTSDSRFQGPVFWYPQSSIGGGTFCPRETLRYGFPPRFRGRYFFMDFVQGWIRSLDPGSAQRPIPSEVFATGLSRPVDLAFAADGSLYVLLRDAWVRDAQFKPGTGSLARIRPVESR
jgi:putative heme-binding domain-containing protein